MRKLLFLALTLIVPACSNGGDSGRGGGGGNVTPPPPTGNQPPGVVLVKPAAGASFMAGSPIVLEADVSDGDGWVAEVQFLQGSTLLATVTAFPFRFPWSGAAAGTYSLIAIATDNVGAQATSLPVSITVGGSSNRPPTVTLTSPPHGSTFPDGYSVMIEANATDPDGAVSGVEFFDGTASLGTVTTTPYRITWTATPPGSHSLRAVATDSAGSATSSASVTVVVEGSASPPTTTVRPEGSLSGVFFADESTGWVVGREGRIYKTTDGGVTWTAQTSGTSLYLGDVQFVSATTGWTVGSGGTILKTVNGGSTWTPQPSGISENLSRLSFVSASTGWVVGSNFILKTTDGGATWTPQQHGSTRGFFGAVSFVNAMKGWVGGDGEILSTSDGGATWSIQPAPSGTGGLPIGFGDARFISETRGAMVGIHRAGGELRTTTDGGATWVRHPTDGVRLYGLAFGDAAHWWAVGEGGQIMASADGGATWAKQITPRFEALYAVWAVSSTTAWAAGDNGTVLRTRDGGATWELLAGGT